MERVFVHWSAKLRSVERAIEKPYLFIFCVHFLFVFVNSIHFAKCLNQMSCNGGRPDRETKKSNRKWFFQQKCFWSEPKTFASFSGVSFVKKHKGNKWRNTKNLSKNFKFLVCFSCSAWAFFPLQYRVETGFTKTTDQPTTYHLPTDHLPTNFR